MGGGQGHLLAHDSWCLAPCVHTCIDYFAIHSARARSRPCGTSLNPHRIWGLSGCAVAIADRAEIAKCATRAASSPITRAASKALDQTDSPSALGKRAGDALKQDGVLQSNFMSPALPASTPEDLLRPASNASSPALPFSPSECLSDVQR